MGAKVPKIRERTEIEVDLINPGMATFSNRAFDMAEKDANIA
ncbi:hypothetical protein BN77_p10481 [Rhizobium mesoamericanum STM3625]|uniref:Uncharacterized protein n=1 Tax=Rhizobium mesoamericanum STM3625 TaxID=1211777 RepID=K0PYY5_9HYPH|nr:hypothetical protein BN77_p10481 [Rhizobium mesoamericanum STM3625]